MSDLLFTITSILKYIFSHYLVIITNKSTKMKKKLKILAKICLSVREVALLQ